MLTRPALLLRLEEACLLTVAVLAYAHFHFSWVLFAVLFLAPDLFMVGYLANPRVGSALYNFGHTLVVPIALFAAAYGMHWRAGMAVGVIWAAHIAFDRLLGYGLKYPVRFQDTHLQHLS
jgi:Domain of unknown function (DUF4260)